MFSFFVMFLEVFAVLSPLEGLTVPFRDDFRRVVLQVEVPDIMAGDCLIVDATAQISARDPYSSPIYTFDDPAFLASQVLMYEEQQNIQYSAPIGGTGVVKITRPTGIDLNLATSIPYAQPTLRGFYRATEYLGTRWFALVMWVRSTAADESDYLRVIHDNHANIIVQRFDTIECE